MRFGREADLEAIAEIYAHYVATSPATFHSEAPGQADWLARFRASAEARHPWLVSEADGAVIGFAYGSAFRPREAYRHTVETTIYLHPDAVGRSLGRDLYGRLIDECRDRSFHLAVGGITLPNDASVKLHEDFGFERVGIFREVGYKLDAWRDVGWWQLRL